MNTNNWKTTVPNAWQIETTPTWRRFIIIQIEWMRNVSVSTGIAGSYKLRHARTTRRSLRCCMRYWTTHQERVY